MGLLLLLISTLLSGYFHPGRAESEQQSFTIRDIKLFIEPSTDVTRDTNVTLRCKATVSISGQVALSRVYTIYKDGTKIYTKTSLTSDDVLYHLPKAKVSNTGKYKCTIEIEGTDVSDTKKLTVTGLAKPILRLSREQVKEGEELTARCIAPDETGNIFFKFYDNSEEILRETSTQAEAKLRFSNVGIHEISCAYTVFIMPDSFTSEKSNNMTVSVRGLSISPVLKISPENDIYEGDQLHISCTISNSLNSSEKTQLQLLQGTIFLGTGDTEINRIVEVKDKNQGEFECILIIGNVKKIANKTLSVTELFSVPALTMSPAEVFQMQEINLTCKSESSGRLRGEKLTYTLDPPAVPVNDKVPGKFVVTAPNVDINYTCVVQAKNITKRSNALMIHPKVAVDAPQISVVSRAILKQPVRILCRSNNGSLPINYTLLRDNEPQDTTTVRLQSQDALFTVTITKPEEIKQFRCKAQNRQEHAVFSARLNAAVIVPLTRLTMIVNPDLADITEGGELYLMCRIEGSPPVTFKFYRVGSEHPLNITTTNSNNTNYQIPTVSKKHSGEYYCEAENHANSIRSERVTIEVRMALWKKVLIGGFCLLVVSVLVVVGVLYFKSKRGKREAASELSVKPSSPKSDDSLTVNLTHDTEVYNAATDAAPLYDGTEGKVTNGVRDSVASLPTDISNRSSYSTPATV